ncbi:U3 small nucleolar RNA-associated protein 5 [Diutina catenulata]
MASIIRSRFDPTNTMLATVQVALDAHQLKVQSVTTSQSSINASYTLDRSVKVTNVVWTAHRGSQVVAMCTSRGSVMLYSPPENKIVSEWTTPAALSLLDYHFSQHTQTGFGCDVGGNLFEWNPNSGAVLSTTRVSDILPTPEPIHRLASVEIGGVAHLLLASHSVYLVDCASKQVVATFPGHVEPVQRILVVDNGSHFATSAKGDRFINLYQVASSTPGAPVLAAHGKPPQVFVCAHPVSDIALGAQGDRSVLVALTGEGATEVFNDPLRAQTLQNPQKKKRRGPPVTSRPPSGGFSLTRPPAEIKSAQDALLPVIATTVSREVVVYAWLEQATVPHFDTMPWVDDHHQLAIDGHSEVAKPKPSLPVTNHEESSHDVAATKHYVEARTIVSDGHNLRDLDNDSDDDEDESLAEKLEKTSATPQPAKKSKKKVKGKSAATLTLMLTQALRNNDHSMLEAVLVNRQPDIIKNTIAKLDASLAVALLDRLSERIQRQATKFDQLNFWLKWIIIIHGAVLASMPNLSAKLSSLHSLLVKKSDTLPRLLELEGRLTLLGQQQRLKREILTGGDDAVDADTDVEYIEELDDASDVELADDYEESDDDDEVMREVAEEDMEIEADDVEADEENYSDLEAE